MTLRKLVWMYRERRRAAGELAAWHVSFVGALMPFVNAKINPADINPYRDRSSRTSREVERVKAFIASMGIGSMAKTPN